MRYYSSIAPEKVLQVAINSSATQIQLNNLTGLPASYPYTLVLDPDTVSEEIVLVTGLSSGTILNISRGTDTVNGVLAGDGTAATSHAIGATVKHMVTGRDLQEPQNHIAASTNVHGLGASSAVVGTTDTQTLTNKTLTTPTIASFTNATHNHTNAAGGGTLTSAAVSDFIEAAQDAVGTAITGGTQNGITVTYNDAGNVYNFDVNDPVISIDGDVAGSATMTNLGNVTINTGITAGVIVNADISGSAAIAASKISGTAVTQADTGTVTSAMIANDTIVNADINSSAQVAYSKLNLTNSIVNNDINASAAIALSKLATDPLARANHTGTQTASTISDFNTAVRTNRLDQMAAPTAAVSLNSQKITSLADPTSAQDAVTLNYITTQKGANSGLASLDAGGKIPSTQLPDIAITNTSVVASQAAMLALTAQTGDVAVRSDLNKTFILTASPASTLANWQELLTPTDSVLSVDGQTGAVSLSGTYLAKAGGTMSGAIAMGTNKVTGMGDPTSAQDAATKNYVDTAVIAPSNLTGVITSVGNVTSIASQTGTGTKFVVDTSPTLVTPNIGVATATSINGTTIPSSKTLVATDSTAYVVPSQGGNSGKFLTTDGTTSSWASAVKPGDYSAKGAVLVGTGAGTYAAQTVGTNGQVLTANSALTNGVEWTTINALPSQTGNAGKYLTTDGTTASWATVVTDPTADIFMMMGA